MEGHGEDQLLPPLVEDPLLVHEEGEKQGALALGLDISDVSTAKSERVSLHDGWERYGSMLASAPRTVNDGTVVGSTTSFCLFSMARSDERGLGIRFLELAGRPNRVTGLRDV